MNKPLESARCAFEGGSLRSLARCPYVEEVFMRLSTVVRTALVLFAACEKQTTEPPTTQWFSTVVWEQTSLDGVYVESFAVGGTGQCLSQAGECAQALSTIQRQQREFSGSSIDKALM